MDKKTKSYYKSQAAMWEARYWELKEVAQRLAAQTRQAREEAAEARAEAAAERGAREEAERNIWAA